MKDVIALIGALSKLVLPIVVLVLGFMYRRPLYQLCGNLKRVKLKDWEGEWHHPGQENQGETLQPGTAELERARVEVYKRQEGLFLVHELRPSLDPKQLYDVGVFVVGHLDQRTGKTAPLREIDRVEYQLGPKFGKKPITVRSAGSGFRLNTSAYGPFVCLARVHFKDPQKPPTDLTDYVYFECGE